MPSHGIWQRRFGGDPAVIGRTIRMNNFPFEIVCVMGCGLMVRSFLHLRNVDPGFEPQNVLTFEIGLQGASGNYRPRQTAAFHTTPLDCIRSLPGVTSAGAVSCLPYPVGAAASRWWSGAFPRIPL